MENEFISANLFNFLPVFGVDRSEHVRPQQAQVHQAGGWDSVISPLGNSLSSYLADFRNRVGSAEFVNECICVHTRIKALFNFVSQAVFSGHYVG